MKFTPYPFQRVAVEHAVEFLNNAPPDSKQLYAAPTGCGKSVVELLVQERTDSWIVSPREEIIAGMLDKLEKPDADMLDCRICTPIRLRNLLMKGSIPHPKRLIFDETHHHEANTWQQLDLLTGLTPAVGYTATPYRGTPKSTKKFRDTWGDPTWLITYKEAESMKYITMPQFSIMPLVDDDIVDVSNGDFEVTSLEGATVDRLGDAAEQATAWHSGHLWDAPTVFALPSTSCCVRLLKELLQRGLPAVIVSASTPREERYKAFEATKDRLVALLHINIVQEGVDFPFRRLVDLAPTLSPVKWVQQLGRITRPTDGSPPQYICTNRNLERHAYALAGSVPIRAIAESEAKFKPTDRAHARVLGLEAIGRFKPDKIRTVSGVYMHIYALSVQIESAVVEYCVLVHPTNEPVWASKINTVTEEGKKWGTWRKCEAPMDLRGFASKSANAVTEKQMAWWKKSAARFGIDSREEPNRKTFQALPVLCDLSNQGVQIR